MLSIQSQEYAKRLQGLKIDEVLSISTDANPVVNRTSIDTATSVRSITDSILSLYGHESLYGTSSEYEGEVEVDQARVSRIIEDYIRNNVIIDLDITGSPHISPYTSKYSSDSNTAINDEALEKLEVEYFYHLAATDLGISFDFYKYNSDGHQYDSERIIPSYLLRDNRGATLKESYVQVVTFEKSKEWRSCKSSIALPRRIYAIDPDRRPMTILDLVLRQLPLHSSFKLRIRYLHPEKRAMMILDYLVRQVSLPDAVRLRQGGVPLVYSRLIACRVP